LVNIFTIVASLVAYLKTALGRNMSKLYDIGHRNFKISLLSSHFSKEVRLIFIIHYFIFVHVFLEIEKNNGKK